MHAAAIELAQFVVDSRLESVGESARDEAVRALVNWLGCALGGCLDPAIDSALGCADRAETSSQATLLGLGERMDPATAAFAAAMSSGVLGYGDTHPQHRIRVSPAVAGAVFALAESRACSGAEVLHAFLLGAEVACRIAPARGEDARPDASALCGAPAAAAACAKLLGLDAAQIAHAIRLAAMGTQLQDGAGRTHPDAWRLGAAARAGLSAALRVERGERADDAPAGRDALGMVLPGKRSLARLGSEWQFAACTYRAFPCEEALHTAIEACLIVRGKRAPAARDIDEVVVRLAPSRASAADLSEPASSAQARRSVQHAAAVALLDGDAGSRQFAEKRVASSRVKRLRARVRLAPDASLDEDAGAVAVRLSDGSALDAHVRCRLGGPQRPLGNDALNSRFRALAAEALATDQAERLLALAWNIAVLSDIGALVRASVPEDAIDPAELPGSPLLSR